MTFNPEFLHNLGVPAKWQLVDVYGLDADILAVVPRPVLAVLLLFPWSVKFTDFNATKEDGTEKDQIVSDKVYFLKQVISNACGTIALIHSVANNTDKIQLGDGHLKQFIDDTIQMNPEERGEYLLSKAGGIITAHKEVALEGQTEDAAEVCKKYIEHDPENLRFTVVALTAAVN
uniref:Ubiquitin carboxyl-terminal hydrolase n=1 Tax=Timema poppense TaxID=170557 RepID=A0A7R9H222_TIMPO|nr:unnamed protein product [Timema poppensis]